MVTQQCLVGSLTGEVDSYNATESYKGWLIPDGNRNESVNAQASLTVRNTIRADSKEGVSDLLIVHD